MFYAFLILVIVIAYILGNFIASKVGYSPNALAAVLIGAAGLIIAVAAFGVIYRTYIFLVSLF